MKINLPGERDRLSIIGATGSGKTIAGLWHLSRRDFDRKPWLIYDFKGDETIQKLDIPEISVEDEIPNEPGLYVVRPLPSEDDLVSEQLFRAWNKGDTGIYVDEGYMLGNRNGGFRAILTQGRSLRVPVICCVQRPVDMDRFLFSESNFFHVFRLQHKKDVELVKNFVRGDLDFDRVPEFYSYFYDAKRNRLFSFEPVPDEAAIVDTIEERLEEMKAKHRTVYV